MNTSIASRFFSLAAVPELSSRKDITAAWTSAGRADIARRICKSKGAENLGKDDGLHELMIDNRNLPAAYRGRLRISNRLGDLSRKNMLQI
jgi:hypothetical protein